jgi:hypothetical protein
MLRFAVKYRKPIKKTTGDKKLPNFRKYRLEDDEWTVVEELVAVLEVAACLASDQVILGTYLIHW